MKMLSLPRLRQTYNYDCGVKAFQAVLVYYGIEVREDILIKQTKTSKQGTSPEDVIRVAKDYGLKVIYGEMSISEIKKYIDKKIPVILSLQAWTDKKNPDWRKNWKDGHYAVAIGYTKDRVFFEDPSSFNPTYLNYDELEKRWHDVDKNGKKYFHYGIALFGKKPTFKKDKIIHMD